MLKVLVADDERIARDIIKLLLKDQTDVSEVFEANNGKEALDCIRNNSPDIIFLDIEMPGETGIELAEKLSPNSVVIFITAYNQYGVEAFELNAVDYLLKPFEDERFYESLSRGRRALAENKMTDYANITRLFNALQDPKCPQYRSRLTIKESGCIRLLEVDQINYICGAGNYAEIHLLDGTHTLHRETLTTLEKQLDPEKFVRIHRSTIVRQNAVSELRPNDKGDYAVHLKSGEVLTLSRRHKAKLDDLLG